MRWAGRPVDGAILRFSWEAAPTEECKTRVQVVGRHLLCLLDRFFKVLVMKRPDGSLLAFA